jgi:phospholipid transport system substrate-binding protein
MIDHENALAKRRDVLGLGAGTLLAGMLPWRAVKGQSVGASPVGPVEALNNALLAAMKAGGRAPFAERYRMLSPVVEQVFDLQAVLRRSVGLSWSGMPEDQKATLANAFQRYTVSTYLANFDSFNGQSFQVSPSARPVGDGQVVVESRLVRVNDDPVTIDYVMQREPAGWRPVDVLTNGAISRVAVQRSDFRGLLSHGGVPALTASLESKVASLSGGMTG